MRNPPWLRDELILCLNAYFKLKPQTPDPKLTAVKELSAVLRKLADNLGIKRSDNYRTPASVVMKMMNIRSLDPEYHGDGLEAKGRGDGQVWNEFSQDKKRLSETAEAISRALSDKLLAPSDDPESAYEEDAVEGRLLTALHRRRERNRKIVKRKKERFLSLHGKIYCEACRFDYPSKYGERGTNFMECHHLKPLGKLKAAAKTRLDDLALLCASCHRMIHVRNPWLTMDELKAILVAN
jgi:5-methylcytosine-specific restriction protein A